jgi:hypothetical protein
MGKVLTKGEWRARSLLLWRHKASMPTLAELSARGAKLFPGWEPTGDHDLLIGVQFQTEDHADAVRAWWRERLDGEAFVLSQGREVAIYCQFGHDAALVRRHWADDPDAAQPRLSSVRGLRPRHRTRA